MRIDLDWTEDSRDPLFLRAPIAPALPVARDDVGAVLKGLDALGYYDAAAGGIPPRSPSVDALEDGDAIKRFQADHGLEAPVSASSRRKRDLKIDGLPLRRHARQGAGSSKHRRRGDKTQPSAPGSTPLPSQTMALPGRCREAAQAESSGALSSGAIFSPAPISRLTNASCIR